MLSRHITNDKWLDGKFRFMGQRICVEESVSNDQKWSFYVEYIGPTLMCVTYVNDKVKDMFPLSRLYL